MNFPLQSRTALVFGAGASAAGPGNGAAIAIRMAQHGALVFAAEREETDIMRRPPRAPGAALFSMAMILASVLQGGVAFVLLAAIFLIGSGMGMAADEVRALTFFALIGAIVALILVNRSLDSSIAHAIVRGNIALRYVVAVIVVLAGVILLVRPAQILLRFGPLHAMDLLIVAGTGAALLVALEGLKALEARIGRRNETNGDS